MRVFKSAPNAVLAICGTVIVLGILGSLVAITLTSHDVNGLFRLLNLIFNSLGIVLGGGSFLYAGVAATKANEGNEKLNGQFDARVMAIVKQALDETGVSNKT